MYEAELADQEDLKFLEDLEEQIRKKKKVSDTKLKLGNAVIMEKQEKEELTMAAVTKVVNY